VINILFIFLFFQFTFVFFAGIQLVLSSNKSTYIPLIFQGQENVSDFQSVACPASFNSNWTSIF